MNQKTNNKFFLKQKRALNLFLLHYFKYLAVFLSILVFVIGVLYVVKPRYAEMNKIVEEDKKKKEAEIKEIEDYLSKLESFKESFNAISENDIKRINTMIPDKFSPEDLFPEIEALIGGKGMITSIEINEKEKSDTGSLLEKLLKKKANPQKSTDVSASLGKAIIKVNVVGITYYDLKQILFDIENNLHLMDVTNIDYNPENKKVTLEITTYYLKK